MGSWRDKAIGMTQEERWLARYNEVMGFLEESHRNPSKHRIEEHDMVGGYRPFFAVSDSLPFFFALYGF